MCVGQIFTHLKILPFLARATPSTAVVNWLGRGTWDWLEDPDNHAQVGPPTWGECGLSVSLISLVCILQHVSAEKRGSRCMDIDVLL